LFSRHFFAAPCWIDSCCRCPLFIVSSSLFATTATPLRAFRHTLSYCRRQPLSSGFHSLPPAIITRAAIIAATPLLILALFRRREFAAFDADYLRC